MKEDERLQQIEKRFERIKAALQSIGLDASGFPDPPVSGSRSPHRGLLADQLYAPDEEPNGVRS